MGNVGAIPQINDPTVKQTIANKNKRRTPNRSIKKAESGINAPFTSIYPVNNH